ncbi:hypothetical protein [Kitasatospora viridis]|uniref:hypothetical protein n=1 Tax=Kitasatospora viridis TaxID=281105 RepID=UPI00119DB9B0|nr:hypothetical protein [Kitasatospora viridis]
MALPTRAQRAAIAQRRADAVELQLAGVDHRPQALLRPSDQHRPHRVPQGYGAELYAKGKELPDDAALIRYACKDVSTRPARRHTELDIAVDELRIVHHMRLERLFFVAFRRAVKDGDLLAIDRAVRILERDSRLLGIDAPARTQLSGPDDEPSPPRPHHSWGPARQGREGHGDAPLSPGSLLPSSPPAGRCRPSTWPSSMMPSPGSLPATPSDCSSPCRPGTASPAAQPGGHRSGTCSSAPTTAS